MFASLLDSGMQPLLKQVARFAERRHDVLAGNIANIDTPGYRMRDLPVKDFESALKAAIHSQKPSGHRTASGSQHPGPAANSTGSQNPVEIDLSLLQPETIGMPAKELAEFFPEKLFTAEEARSQPGITFQDANNRSIEQQMLLMTKNQMLRNFALQVLNLQYNQLHAVISEKA